MPYVTADLVNIVLQRTRDAGGLATPRDLVRRMLTRVQWTLNANTGFVLGTVTLATVPYQQVYQISALAPDVIRILSIYEDGRELGLVQWSELFYTSKYWFRAVGGRHRLFSTIGRDLLVIHPARDTAGAVTVKYSKLTANLEPDATEQTAIDVPDDVVPLMLDYTVAVISLRNRVYGPLNGVLQDAGKRGQLAVLEPTRV